MYGVINIIGVAIGIYGLYTCIEQIIGWMMALYSYFKDNFVN